MSDPGEPKGKPNPDLPFYVLEKPKDTEGMCEKCGERHRHLAFCPDYIPAIPRTKER